MNLNSNLNLKHTNRRIHMFLTEYSHILLRLMKKKKKWSKKRINSLLTLFDFNFKGNCFIG